MSTFAVPRAFIGRRLHSLMGLWLVLFLIEHLFVNSQVALWLGENGRGFVELVNGIHNLPYLQVIEVTLLGVPILLHGILGIRYLLTSKLNAHRTDGRAPVMKTGRNRAYSWQRITSWLLLVGLVLHVVKFRFIDYPDEVSMKDHSVYLTVVSVDQGLYAVADRLDVTLYDAKSREIFGTAMEARQAEEALVAATRSFKQTYDLMGPVSEPYDEQKALIVSSAQTYQADLCLWNQMKKYTLGPDEVIAVAGDFGTASLLGVRDTFKVPLYGVLYTVFVLAACFHAFNGFWTFLLTWGWILKMSAQRAWTTVAVVLMLAVILLGLASIWGTYWYGAA